MNLLLKDLSTLITEENLCFNAANIQVSWREVGTINGCTWKNRSSRCICRLQCVTQVRWHSSWCLNIRQRLKWGFTQHWKVSCLIYRRCCQTYNHKIWWCLTNPLLSRAKAEHCTGQHYHQWSLDLRPRPLAHLPRTSLSSALEDHQYLE